MCTQFPKVELEDMAQTIAAAVSALCIDALGCVVTCICGVFGRWCGCEGSNWLITITVNCGGAAGRFDEIELTDLNPSRHRTVVLIIYHRCLSGPASARHVICHGPGRLNDPHDRKWFIILLISLRRRLCMSVQGGHFFTILDTYAALHLYIGGGPCTLVQMIMKVLEGAKPLAHYHGLSAVFLSLTGWVLRAYGGPDTLYSAQFERR